MGEVVVEWCGRMWEIVAWNDEGDTETVDEDI